MLRRTYEIEEKKAHVESYKNSGMSMAEYAKENDIPSSTFKEWMYEDRNLSFGAIEIKQSNTNISKTYKNSTVFVSENIRIELKEGFDKTFLKRIVEVLIYDN